MEFVAVVGSGWGILEGEKEGVRFFGEGLGAKLGRHIWGELSMLPLFPLVGLISLNKPGTLPPPSHLFA